LCGKLISQAVRKQIYYLRLNLEGSNIFVASDYLKVPPAERRHFVKPKTPYCRIPISCRGHSTLADDEHKSRLVRKTSKQTKYVINRSAKMSSTVQGNGPLSLTVRVREFEKPVRGVA
jgi:hypothetical protein